MARPLSPALAKRCVNMQYVVAFLFNRLALYIKEYVLLGVELGFLNCTPGTSCLFLDCMIKLDGW